MPRLQGPAQVADEQLKAALAQLDAMTVGKGDPNYAAALAAVRQATAAVSGTDPATGQPYAEGYAGLPAELTALAGRPRRGRRAKRRKSPSGWSPAVRN